MKIPLILAATAALAFAPPLAQAAVIHSEYTSLGSNNWLADFTLTNDGTPASFAGFSVDIPNATNLVLRGSPAAWDSAVFQPDASLADDGFLDSFLRNGSSALAPGQSISGFGVSFAYAAGAMPGPLPFMIYSENFTPLAAGTTQVTAIPEPATALLSAFGLAAVGLRTLQARARNRASAKEVTA